MKIRVAYLSILMFISNLAVAAEDMAPSYTSLPEQIEMLKVIFKDGADNGFKKLNETGEGATFKDMQTDYSVCYAKDGDKVMRMASTKLILPVEDITNVPGPIDSYKQFVANPDGKTIISYFYKEKNKQAIAIDINSLDAQYPKDKGICVAIKAID